MRTFICARCGRTAQANGTNVKYCTDCRRSAGLEKRRLRKKSKRIPPSGDGLKSISAFELEARAHGLSYGQLAAVQRRGETP